MNEQARKWCTKKKEETMRKDTKDIRNKETTSSLVHHEELEQCCHTVHPV